MHAMTAAKSAAANPVADLTTMLSAITRGIVDNPDDVVIFPAAGDGFVHFEVRCHNGDVGTLVGRRGTHADAIRLLMMAAGAVRQFRVTLQIVSRDGDDNPR